MSRNVEIKARLSDIHRVRALIEGMCLAGPELLLQKDTFFNTREGKLKLREYPSGKGELIGYKRERIQGPRQSDYFIYKTDHPAELKKTLSLSLGIIGMVRKKRVLYLYGRTRIHLDEVDDLGCFLELEVVLKDNQDKKDGIKTAQEIMEKLGIQEENIVHSAYIDLMLQG